MARALFNETGKLARFVLRRDRVRLPVWLLSIALITIFIAPAFEGLYKTEQERQVMAETMKNPAMTAMLGKGYGLDHYTTGAMMAHQMLLFTAVAVAIMSILLVTRHTRGDEEDGRIEMIRSLPAGRLSSLTSTMIVMVAGNLFLALVAGFGLYALNIESMNLEGSILYGAALGATGIFFAAMTAFFAQLAENSRGTIGFSFTVLGAAYLLRAIGDVSNETLSWLSPLGWITGTEVYVNNYWWPIGLTLIMSAVIAALAMFLNSIRDLGSGFLQARPGRRHASQFLQSPLGLGFRLQRTSIISWAIGVFALGISYGSVMGDLESFFKGNEMMREMLTPIDGFTLTEQYLTMLMSVVSMISAIPALMMVLKLRGEEKKNRTEHLLVRPVSRSRLLASYVTISLLAGLLMQVIVVIGLWSAGSAVMEAPIPFGTYFSAGLAYLPAIWVMTGVAVLLTGFWPQFTGFTWFFMVYSFIVIYMGELLKFPEWMSKLSPFGYVPQLPVEEFSFVKVFLLTMAAAVLTIAGFIGYRKRNIEG